MGFFGENAKDVFIGGMGGLTEEFFETMAGDPELTDTGFNFSFKPGGFGLFTTAGFFDGSANSSVDARSYFGVTPGSTFTERTISILREFVPAPSKKPGPELVDGREILDGGERPTIRTYPYISGMN